MQRCLEHSPKGLRSTGLEEKSPGTPDRTLEKQNNCMDSSRTPAFPLLQIHPCTSRVFWMPAVLQQPTSVLFIPKQHLQSSRVLHTLSSDSLSNPTPPPTAMLPTGLYHLGDLPVDTNQAWPLYHLISPCCSHFSLHHALPCRTAGLCSKKMRVLQVWETRQNQNNLKVNILRKSIRGYPGMKHVIDIKCTIKIRSIISPPFHRRPWSNIT